LTPFFKESKIEEGRNFKETKNISSFEMLRSFLATLPLVQSKLGLYRKKIKKGFMANFKGFRRDSFIYLGLVSAILFSIFVFGSGSILNAAPPEGGFSFLTTYSESDNQEQMTVSSQIKAAESPDLCIIQKNSLTPFNLPLTVTPQVLGQIVGENSASDDNEKEILEYTVQEGDTLNSLAEKFGVSKDTILWANDLTKSASIKTGENLLILPVSGVLYNVKKGDTLSEIAKTYKGEVNEIVAFNDLASAADIYISDVLIIPNGVLPAPAKRPAPSYAPLAASYFICPISAPCRRTQGLHWDNAVDLSNGVCGAPIYAAAGGVVLNIKYGWNFGGGNYLKILHPNGVITYYGHLQAILVNQGDSVSQGQVIALMGGQPGLPGAGHSTGCHLHFQVNGAKNPFAK